MAVKPTVETVEQLLASMGNSSRRMLRVRVQQALEDRESRQMIGLSSNLTPEALSMSQLGELWRGHIGPRYYWNSILSVESQVELLGILGRTLAVYRARKRKMLAQRHDNWSKRRDADNRELLSHAAWSSINKTDSRAGLRLQLGFRNVGCKYWQSDDDGIGCYACGYFAGCCPSELLDQCSEEDISTFLIEQFIGVLEKHNTFGNPDYDTIDIVGDGSFFNSKEVPVFVQNEVFRIVSGLRKIKRILVESLPIYVSSRRVQEILSILRPDQKLEIAVGLETADPFVSSFLINKSFLPKGVEIGDCKFDGFDRFVQELSDCGKRCVVQAYVLMKPALLTESECITDTVNTVRWLHQLSRDTGFMITAKIEPTVVCYGSLLEVLNDTRVSSDGAIHIDPEDGDPPNDWAIVHSPPSYWSVVEVVAETILDHTYAIVRVGAREDMDVFKAIPGVHEGDALDPVDAVLYNAVQDFNLRDSSGRPEVVRFLAAVFHMTDEPSFDRWRRQAHRHIPVISELCGHYQEEIRKLTAVKRFWASGLKRAAAALMENHAIRDAALTIAEQWKDDDISLHEKHCHKLIPLVREIITQEISYIDKNSVVVDQLQYILYPHKNVRFQVSIYGANADGKLDIWTIIPLAAQANRDEAERVEIERKWIVDEVPVHLLGKPQSLIQAYVGLSKKEEVRVRRKENKDADGADDPFKYVLTVKSSGGRTRKEYEPEIDKTAFETLLLAGDGRLVEKDRYLLVDQQRIPELCQSGETFKIEMDVYKGDLFGMVTAEVEFKTHQAADNFQAPKWFGQEVTEDRRFKNQCLACEGMARIILRPHPGYAQKVIILSSSLPATVSVKLDEICRSFDPPFSIVNVNNLTRFVGRITRDTAKIIWGCAAIIALKEGNDPATVALLALTCQTHRPIVTIDALDPACTLTGGGAWKAELTKALRQTSLMGSVVDATSDYRESLSKIVQRQRFLDNEILSAIEAKASVIHVLTTTLEYDLGDLKGAVLQNLKQGKGYRYYLPGLGSDGCDFPELRANLRAYADTYASYSSQIQFFSLPMGYKPYYHEIIIYEQDDSAHVSPFAFTYLEQRDTDSDLELFEIPGGLANTILAWLRAHTTPYTY